MLNHAEIWFVFLIYIKNVMAYIAFRRKNSMYKFSYTY